MNRSLRRRRKIYQKTGGTCRYCGKPLAFDSYGKGRGPLGGIFGSWEIDHSVPKAKGGTDHLNNLYPACPSCNRSKGAKKGKNVEKDPLGWLW